jgi:hypothetical protein
MVFSYARINSQTRDELAANFCALIREGRRILIHPDLQNDAKLIAIERLLDEHAPPPGFPAPGEGRAGETAGSAGTHSPALFTDYAARVAGEDVNARIISCVQVSARIYPDLMPGLPGAGVAWRREGTLVTLSERPVAEIVSVYLPQRMPPSAELLLDAGVPLGRALAPGVRREELPPGNGCTRGRLWIPGPDGEWPVALAMEHLLI